MTITDYVLIGMVAVAAIYIVYRLFMGWRNSVFPQDQSELGAELNASREGQPGHDVATTRLENRVRKRGTERIQL